MGQLKFKVAADFEVILSAIGLKLLKHQICHKFEFIGTKSRTTDLPSVCRSADILVVAVGRWSTIVVILDIGMVVLILMFLTRAEMVKRDWVKPGAVVIDCGKYLCICTCH